MRNERGSITGKLEISVNTHLIYFAQRFLPKSLYISIKHTETPTKSNKTAKRREKKNWSKKSIDKKYYIINYDVVCFHTRFHIVNPNYEISMNCHCFMVFSSLLIFLFLLIYEKIIRNNKNINKLLENIEKCAAIVVS